MPFSISSSRSSSPSLSGTSTPATERSVIFDFAGADLLESDYILVTGGLGFIGSHTSLELLKAGHNVIIVDDLSNAFHNVLDRINLAADLHYAKNAPNARRPTLKLWEADYRDQSAMRALLKTYSNTWSSKIKGVIHFAAFKAVGESIKSPLKYYRNNINGLVDFLTLLEEHEIKNFIFSSSATVYGTAANRGIPLQEQDCVHADDDAAFSKISNPYGRTKFFGEAILADLAASDPSWNIIALRYFNPIGCDSTGLLGEDPRGAPSNLLPAVVKVVTGEWSELSIFGSDWDTSDGTAVRDFIHVSDLATGHIAALNTFTQSKTGFSTYNLGTGSGHSVQEVVDTMRSVSKKSIPCKLVARRAGDVGSCVAMAGKANAELSWKTQKSLRDACEDICNFLTLRDAAQV